MKITQRDFKPPTQKVKAGLGKSGKINFKKWSNIILLSVLGLCFFVFQYIVPADFFTESRIKWGRHETGSDMSLLDNRAQNSGTANSAEGSFCTNIKKKMNNGFMYTCNIDNLQTCYTCLDKEYKVSVQSLITLLTPNELNYFLPDKISFEYNFEADIHEPVLSTVTLVRDKTAKKFTQRKKPGDRRRNYCTADSECLKEAKFYRWNYASFIKPIGKTPTIELVKIQNTYGEAETESVKNNGTKNNGTKNNSTKIDSTNSEGRDVAEELVSMEKQKSGLENDVVGSGKAMIQENRNKIKASPDWAFETFPIPLAKKYVSESVKITALDSGKVVHIQMNSQGENTVKVYHGEGLHAYYGPFKELEPGLLLGINVKKGETIGYLDGNSEEPFFIFKLEQWGRFLPLAEIISLNFQPSLDN